MQNRQSLIALNWLNFFAADVATGVGPFLAIYLTAHEHWRAGQIGIALSVMSFSTVFAQSPAGYYVDRTRHKRAVIICASVLMGIAGILIPIRPAFVLVVSMQCIMGICAAFYLPDLIALASCLGERKDFDKTISTNQTFNHAGNVISAISIGVLGKFTNNQGVFYCLQALSVFCILSTLAIKPGDLDNASPTEQKNGEVAIDKGLWEIFKNRPLLIFLLVSFIFHFANAAMLPLVGEEISKGKHENSSLYMAACIILAQIVMVPVTYICGRQVSKGRKWLLIIAFIVLPVRGMLYTFSENAIYLVSIQVLDGIAAGIFGVVSIIVISDLTKDSGRSIFVQGVLATVVGLGASLSNLLSGFVVDHSGFKIAFISLSALAAGALALLWIAMPETGHNDMPAMR